MSLLAGDKKSGPPGPSLREDKVSSNKTGDLHTLLGKGSEFEGKLSFVGQVRIDGTFRGMVRTDDVLVLGDTADVQAEIDAGTVVISGSFDGAIRASQLVEIHAPARVKGSIETPALTIAKGVLVDATIKMSDTKRPAPNVQSSRALPPLLPQS